MTVDKKKTPPAIPEYAPAEHADRAAEVLFESFADDPVVKALSTREGDYALHGKAMCR
jgi:hypothetical protein